MGTTAENATMSQDEKEFVIQTIVDTNTGRLPLVLGVGGNNTTEVVEELKNRDLSQFVAILSISPYYNKPTQEGLFLHYKAISDAVDIPQILYNVPGRTACDMLPDTIGRLSKLANIVGVKEATGDLSRVQKIRDLTSENFAIYTGDDATSLEFCLLGGNGTITVTGNVAPRLVHQMIVAAMSGDKNTALAIDTKLASLHKNLFIQSNPIPVKWAMTEMGLMNKGIRLPLTWLTDDCFTAVRNAMREAEVIQ